MPCGQATVRMAPPDSGIDCATLLFKAVEAVHCLTFVGMGKARIWQRNCLMRLLCYPLPLRNRRRQPGCATCLIPNQASGASALAAAFVTVALTGGPYVIQQWCAVSRLLLSRRHGLKSGSVRDQTGTCRPLDATPEDGSNTGIIHAGAPYAIPPSTIV
jgi:hypothetical protein